ncbi:MAG: sigma factor-like helix-turn-helix DNA-binding protein, partial [Balneolaceae bacterium]
DADADTGEGLLNRKIDRCIQKLPERQRQAFELSRFDGLDHDEIAYVMDVSVKTVNNHIVLALRFLRDCVHEVQKNDGRQHG